jgi:hypothetical protein
VNNYKHLATILFRVLGVSYIVFAVLYWPYYLLICHYSTPGTYFIVATLYSLVYIALGLFLIILSKRLAALVARGLDRE